MKLVISDSTWFGVEMGSVVAYGYRPASAKIQGIARAFPNLVCALD